MSAALILLKPRSIKASEDAIAELDLPVIELVGYTEAQLAGGIFKAALELHPHDLYLVASDDLIIRQHAVDEVLDCLAALDGAAACVTGYCQFTHTDWRVNLTRKPLAGDRPSASAYEFLSFHEIVAGPSVRRSWFTGMSLTAMTREMWAEFPFDCYLDEHGRGYSSDYHLSLRLQQADVPIWAVRDGFAYHWRHTQQHTNDPRDDQLVVGKVNPEIRRR